MYNGAAHLADHVIPDVPIRQFVLSVPFELRLLLAARANAFTALTNVFIHEVFRWQREQARVAGLKNVKCGAVAAHHRGGNSMNLHPHVHAVLPEGVFLRTEGQERAEFHRLPGPSQGDLVEIAFNIHQRFLRWLTRHHLLKTESENDLSNEPVELTALEACAQGALGLGGLVTIRRRGGFQQQDAGDQDFESRGGSPRVGEWQGYSLYAGEVILEGNVDARERLLRYCLRPPLSLERLSVRQDGQIVYQVKATRHGKATQRVMSPLQFMGRLVALIPPPRRPLWRYFGVFAPHCRARASVVPGYPEAAASDPAPHEHQHAPVETVSSEVSTRTQSEAEAAADPATSSPESAASTVPQPGVDSPGESDVSVGGSSDRGEAKARRDRPRFSAPWRIDWATLLKRVWNVEALACPCGGRLKFVALVTDESKTRRALEKAGLPAEPPPIARARSPTAYDEPPPDWDE
jgi:hypothetical protein